MQYVAKHAPRDAPLTPEAKAYVKNLQLSDVEIKANKSYLNQMVVEIDGKIGNAGDRPLDTVEIYCAFLRFLRPVGAALARSHRQPAHGRIEAGRNENVPAAVRRNSGELESADAATGHRRRKIPLMSRVLLVDDDADALAIRKLIFENDGHQVTAASTATAPANISTRSPRQT